VHEGIKEAQPFVFTWSLDAAAI